jgi:phage terminase large subunit-like protein
MVEFRATMANFSPAITELDAAMRSGRLQQDGNPVLEWCIGNVVGKPDRRGNFYPTKARPEQKIDAAVALIMAIGRAMGEPVLPTSIFENLVWEMLQDGWRQVRDA